MVQIQRKPVICKYFSLMERGWKLFNFPNLQGIKKKNRSLTLILPVGGGGVLRRPIYIFACKITQLYYFFFFYNLKFFL